MTKICTKKESKKASDDEQEIEGVKGDGVTIAVATTELKKSM
jgi:hypothetical protein